MIGKNNQHLKNQKQGVKVETYSIKKFKVGAASVVIGASIFFGAAGVANAAEVSGEKTEKNIAVEKVTSPTDEKIDVLNNKISAEKEVAKPAEKEEVSADATPTVNNNANTDKKVEKKALDKNTLKTNIEKVEELLEKINKEKAPASTLAAIKIDLENAKNILNSNNAELTQAEIDVLVKKLNEKISVLSSMPKANTPEKVVKEGKNTIANTGTRDLRNGQSMGEGTQFRANGEINSGALANIKYFASVDPNDNSGRSTRNDEPELTLNKTEIKAVYVQDREGKWIVYDVFFNNDGHKMVKNSLRQQYFFQAPFNIMHSSNTVKDLSFTRYRNTGGRRLSDGFQGFTPYGNTANISNVWDQNYNIFNGDTQSMYDPRSGVYRDNLRWDVFKNNQNDPTLNTLTKNKNGQYPNASYYLGIKMVGENVQYAVHMHAKIRLRDDVTPEEAARYGRVYAASTTYGTTTNQSYIMGATGTRLTTKTDAQLSPIQGSTHNKTVGDTLPNPDNPVAAKYITPKNGGEFPGGMSWSWKNNNKPSTAEAGVFKYTAVATYQDGSKSDAANSGSDGTVTLNVKPIKPTITANDVVHKKGLTNQTITVNVGTGVKNGSTVTLYDGTNVIGTGTTNGTTARITVASALPGRPITAVTTVNNNGTVISEKSDGVTPTDAPDNQAPTVKMTNPTDGNRVSVLTSNETNAPTTRIYRGATLNVPLSMYDNDPKGKVNLKYVSGLPKGVTFNNGTTLSKNGAIETNPGTTNVTGKVAADAQLGKQTVTFKVSDDQGNNVDSGNRATVKFNVEVVDLAFQKNKGEVKSDGTLVVKTAKGTSYTDSHDFITATNGTSAGDQLFPG